MELTHPFVGMMALLLAALAYSAVGLALLPRFDANPDVLQSLMYIVLWPVCLVCLLVELAALWCLLRWHARRRRPAG